MIYNDYRQLTYEFEFVEFINNNSSFHVNINQIKSNRIESYLVEPYTRFS